MDGVREYGFECPYCGEPITMVLDLSGDGEQDYIEDCEVCCRPVRVRFHVDGGLLERFTAESIE